MKKILIAEDDKFLLNAYRVKLSKAGFEIKTALDGDEAIVALKDFTPDIILLDLVMPVKDGFTTLQELKAHPQWKSIPVIIASNLGQKEDVAKGMQMGAVDFVVKTDLSMNVLVEKINAALTPAAKSL